MEDFYFVQRNHPHLSDDVVEPISNTERVLLHTEQATTLSHDVGLELETSNCTSFRQLNTDKWVLLPQLVRIDFNHFLIRD
jgi:hypothetical protein